MELVVIFLPLLSSLFTIGFSFLLGFRGSVTVILASMGISLLGSVFIFCRSLISDHITHLLLFSWFEAGLLKVNWAFIFDPLVSIMLVVVSIVSFIVHVYSCDYMSGDPHHSRFMSYLSLFTFFMFLLVSASNLVQLFMGWEGVGVASYLLINFWYTRVQANKSALKAMVVNRVGDSFLLLAMVFLYLLFGTVDLPSIFVSAHSFVFLDCGILGLGVSSLTVISIFLFLGAMGKSAQLGFHTWLPDAMEGPTPVSALIHAATMVTAGVFLVVRFSPVFEYSMISLAFVSFIGSLTAFFAATVALFQFDLKKIVAYSTCSQLGYMFLSCGLSSYAGAMFHLYNHAFFKALLFLGAGLIIHVILENQDLRRMGGLFRLIGFSYSSTLIGSLSLMGFPFLTGFYSKDFILESASVWFTLTGRICLISGLVAAFLTSFYSIRILYLVFLSFPKSSFSGYRNISFEVFELYMVFSIAALSFFSIFVGYFSRELLVGFGTDFWSSSVFVLSDHCTGGTSEFVPFYLKLFPVCFSSLGMVISCFLHFWFSHSMINLNLLYLDFFNFLSKKWCFDLIFNEILIRPILGLSYSAFSRGFDRGVLEFFGPFGVTNGFFAVGQRVASLQTGYFYHYIFLMIFFLVCIVSSTVFCFVYCKFFFLFFLSVCFPMFVWSIFFIEEDDFLKFD